MKHLSSRERKQFNNTEISKILKGIQSFDCTNQAKTCSTPKRRKFCEGLCLSLMMKIINALKITGSILKCKKGFENYW